MKSCYSIEKRDNSVKSYDKKTETKNRVPPSIEAITKSIKMRMQKPDLTPKSKNDSIRKVDMAEKSILPNTTREIRVCKIDRKAHPENNSKAEPQGNFDLKIDLDNQLMERLNTTIYYGKNIKESKNTKFKERYKKGVNKLFTKINRFLQI